MDVELPLSSDAVAASLGLEGGGAGPPPSGGVGPFERPLTVTVVGSLFFMWDEAEVVALRTRGRLAITPIGACPTKVSTRGKTAALPALLSDEEAFCAAFAGWLRMVGPDGAPVDVWAALAASVAADPTGHRALRRLVYRDLWRLGYAMTNGIKFGCDYLAYRADPTSVHAAFMVTVLPAGAGVRPLSLTAVSRVATTALKTAVVAWADPASGAVSYAAFRRMGPGSAVFADSGAALPPEALASSGFGGGGAGAAADPLAAALAALAEPDPAAGQAAVSSDAAGPVSVARPDVSASS